MSDGFTIGAAMQAATLFECPQCHETIDSSAAACRFCGAPVDRESAIKAAAVLAQVNQACSDAKFMKTMALAVPAFIVLRFVPFLGMLGLVGFYGLSFAVPIAALRWWVKFGKLDSADAEFRSARSTVLVSGIVVMVVLLVMVVGPIVLAVIALNHPSGR